MEARHKFTEEEKAAHRAVHNHPAKMPVFPIGSWHNEGPRQLEEDGITTAPRGFPCTSFIEQGLYTVTDRAHADNDSPLMLSTRYAEDDWCQSIRIRMYEGTNVGTIAELGHLFTEAYNRVTPAPGMATLIQPTAYVSEFGRLFPFHELFHTNDLCRAILCERTEITLHPLTHGPFAGYTIVRATRGGLQCPLRGGGYYPSYPLNSVASAIWVQSFPPEAKDAQGTPYFLQFLYGPVLLLASDLVATPDEEKQALAAMHARNAAFLTGQVV